MSDRIALRGDLLDFTGAPGWGQVESTAVRFRPDHWLLIEAGQDQPAGVVVALPAFARRLGLGAGDPAVFDQQPVVGPKAKRGGFDLAPARRTGEIEQVAAECDAVAHAAGRLSMP